MFLTTFLGWVRLNFKCWYHPKDVFDANEDECWAKLKKWLEVNRKRRRDDDEKIDLGHDGSVVVLPSDEPPWTPYMKEKSTEGE